jgi:uncharacterized protein YndB with AHSA1/START domain
MSNKKSITIETTVQAPLEKVWEFWTTPHHIMQWNNASDDWYTPRAENDLKVGGQFLYRMQASSGMTGFDFVGTYDEVEINKLIAYTMGDGRKAKITFSQASETATKIVETFEAEGTNSIDLQRTGWQAILDNFKKYTEQN